ncbi:hypothetical protein SAMN05216207_1018136 [Pseudonocardia ammonioxydans]|uniref:Uncharacterized protein n=1 Tax=Pseudonocardia ammonioxydans TaxID=260086 RepID=A0A1I5AU71_PSUAM|nr:hypothetical protein [Pseudonocardia ammonioxydans]SFN65942.1 hypothetical protein SAMN05216207_1018136 [Pseudonocardia ammonioxydans]
MATRTRSEQQPDQRTVGQPTVTEMPPGTAPPATNGADEADGPEPVDQLDQLARRTGQGAVRAVQAWTDLCTRAPIALLRSAATTARTTTGGTDARPSVSDVSTAAASARAVSDAGFDVIATVLATQRRMVDQALATQRDLVGRVVESTQGLAAGAVPGGDEYRT